MATGTPRTTRQCEILPWSRQKRRSDPSLLLWPGQADANLPHWDLILSEAQSLCALERLPLVSPSRSEHVFSLRRPIFHPPEGHAWAEA